MVIGNEPKVGLSSLRWGIHLHRTFHQNPLSNPHVFAATPSTFSSCDSSNYSSSSVIVSRHSTSCYLGYDSTAHSGSLPDLYFSKCPGSVVGDFVLLAISHVRTCLSPSRQPLFPSNRRKRGD